LPDAAQRAIDLHAQQTAHALCCERGKLEVVGENCRIAQGLDIAESALYKALK